MTKADTIFKEYIRKIMEEGVWSSITIFYRRDTLGDNFFFFFLRQSPAISLRLGCSG